MSRSFSTRASGLLLGLLVLLAGIEAGKKGKHEPHTGTLGDALKIVHVTDLGESHEPEKTWELLIVYNMHGPRGDQHAGAVTKTHMIHKTTTFKDLLGHEAGMHSHASVVGMASQLDHGGKRKADIAKLGAATQWFDHTKGSAPTAPTEIDKYYNLQPIYKEYFHDKTVLKLFRVSTMSVHDKTHKEDATPGPDGPVMTETQKGSVVHFIQQHRKELHAAAGGAAGLDDHYLDQQIVLEGNEKGNRIGTIILIASDDDHQPAGAAGGP